ncbi:hypothetical protein ACP70R_025395 [Stipagrostis hirtigluma subsp. patula]
MQMDSYYYAGFHDDAPFFYPHGAAPASPGLPFGLIAAPELPPELEARPSAFRGYAGEQLPAAAQAPHGRSGEENVHRRVMGALGRMEAAATAAAAVGGDQPMRETGAAGAEGEEARRRPGAVESSRGFRHMMRERQRRERLSQSYADLHAMVAARSRGDKNSTVQAAAIYIRELSGARDQLRRRNEELKAKILGHDARQPGVKVQFEVDEPSSAVDSMIAALRRLKSMDVRARGIRSSLSGGRLWTEMNVETTIAACDVEKAVEEALNQAERKPPAPDGGAPFPGTSRGWGPQATHVQNVF